MRIMRPRFYINGKEIIAGGYKYSTREYLHPNRLTADKVRRIRKEYAEKKDGEIRVKYGISQRAFDRIINNQTYVNI
jgi:hypothetical protein